MCSIRRVRIQRRSGGITYNDLRRCSTAVRRAPESPWPEDHALVCHKARGLVSEVFPKEVMEELPASNLAVGHVR